MNPVCRIDASKLIPGEKSIKEIYQDFFTKWGGNIHSDLFGDIVVKNSSVRSEMRHGSTPVKVASIEAIPDVIQNGKIVEWIQKDSGLFRVVVAAPIEIGKTPYFMGVMLQRDAQNQRLYLHDVVIEEEAFDSSREHLDSTGPREENENLHISSILDKIAEVKRKLSLSVEGDIAPVRGGIYGKDIRIQAPTAEDLARMERERLQQRADQKPVRQRVEAPVAADTLQQDSDEDLPWTAESEAMLADAAPEAYTEGQPITTVKERLGAKLLNLQKELTE